MNMNLDGHKLNYHPDRVAQIINHKNSIQDIVDIHPIYIEISPTSLCNHRCSFCAIDYLGYKGEQLPKEVLIKFLADIATSGVKSIMFGGEGEPTLYKDLPEVINKAKAYGLDVALTTNGTGLTEVFLNTCLHSLSWIKVSLDAGQEETYNKLHNPIGKNDWNRVWGCITLATTIKDLKQLQTKIGIQALFLPENCDEMELLITEAAGAGCDYVVIKPYSTQPLSLNKTPNFYDKDLDLLMQRYQEVYSNDHFKVIWRGYSASKATSEKSYSQCLSVPFLWSYLRSNGDLYACSSFLMDDSFNLGNINSNTYTYIWYGEKRVELIEKMKAFNVSKCRQNCRMDKCNEYLWQLIQPIEHKNFI